MSKQPHTHLNVHKVMIAMLVGIIAVPITSTALFLQQDSIETMDINATDLRDTALEDRSRLRAQRRLYWHAIEQFQNGILTEKPDINDPSTYLPTHRSAPEQEVEQEEAEDTDNEITSISTNQLETHDRALLRRYTRAGFCPEGLKDFYIPGFYELCNSLVGESVRREPVTGLLNHNAYLYRALRRSAPETELSGFRLRLKMIDEAYNGTRRDSGALPMRPVSCTMNPDCLTPRSGN